MPYTRSPALLLGLHTENVTEISLYMICLYAYQQYFVIHLAMMYVDMDKNMTTTITKTHQGKGPSEIWKKMLLNWWYV